MPILDLSQIVPIKLSFSGCEVQLSLKNSHRSGMWEFFGKYLFFKKPTWCKCSLAIFHSGARSEAELISGKDDIQADETRPLTFPGTTAININTHKGIHNESTGTVNGK